MLLLVAELLLLTPRSFPLHMAARPRPRGMGLMLVTRTLVPIPVLWMVDLLVGLAVLARVARRLVALRPFLVPLLHFLPVVVLFVLVLLFLVILLGQYCPSLLLLLLLLLLYLTSGRPMSGINLLGSLHKMSNGGGVEAVIREKMDGLLEQATDVLVIRHQDRTA